MVYGKKLRKMFNGVTLKLEDLYVLEPFQIESLKTMAPRKEFAALMFAHPNIKDFFINKQPSIVEYIKEIQEIFGPETNKKILSESLDYFLWEIAILIIYNKYPEVYDRRVIFGWDIKDITSVVSLKDKIVIDAGAGTGRAAFKAVKDADIVFAVEPCNNLRNFIRNKADKNKISNLFIIDGVLHRIPLPKDFADVLITSNAIGWKLNDELIEMERIVKPGGFVIHLLCSDNKDDVNPFKQDLTSSKWNYNYSVFENNNDVIVRFWKKI